MTQRKKKKNLFFSFILHPMAMPILSRFRYGSPPTMRSDLKKPAYG